MGIKAIETEYKGYRFRSRLEARWAVFFDILKIPWEYESEGFDLDGEWYLPDFHLLHIDTWIEIKPRIYNGDDWDAWPSHIMFDYLAKYETWSPRFVLIQGEPWAEGRSHHYQKYFDNGELHYEVWMFDPYDGFAYQAYILGDCYYRWCECPICHKIGIEFGGRAGRLCNCINSDGICNTASPRLLMAYKAARQARFGRRRKNEASSHLHS